MQKKILIGILSLAIFGLAVAPVLAAVNVTTGLSSVKNETGYTQTELPVLIGKIIKIILGFLGLIALIITIVGGFQWMTSGGNEEKIGGAKKLMSAGIVGLVIILIAYAASNFIVSQIAGQV